MTGEHIIRANSFLVTSVKAVSRANASRAAARAVLRRNRIRCGVLHSESVAGLKSAIMEYLDTRNTDTKSFISLELVGEIRDKAACPEKTAIVTTLAGWRSAMIPWYSMLDVLARTFNICVVSAFHRPAMVKHRR